MIILTLSRCANVKTKGVWRGDECDFKWVYNWTEEKVWKAQFNKQMVSFKQKSNIFCIAYISELFIEHFKC